MPCQHLPMQARHSHRGEIKKTIALQVPKYERERAKLTHKNYNCLRCSVAHTGALMRTRPRRRQSPRQCSFPRSSFRSGQWQRDFGIWGREADVCTKTKCIGSKLFDAKCIRLACLLSFASLFLLHFLEKKHGSHDDAPHHVERESK